MRCILLLAIALSSLASPLQACTCFFVANDSVALFARNYDWALERGMLIVNKRGVAKQAFSFDRPASWESRYGSITFNQYGREFPNDGMNEAGLVVAVMWLDTSKYPEPDERPSMGSAQWVQYQLDTAATVDDVLASDNQIRISSAGGGMVHYLVADASGNAAVIEWIDGKRVVHTGESLVAAALTNSTYERSVDYLRRHQEFGGDRPIPATGSSLDRFVRAASTVAKGVDDAAWDAEKSYAGLANVAQGSRTQWSIVYDVKNRAVEFRTQSAPAIKSLSMASLDLSTDSPVKVLPIATTGAGDVASRLKDYDTEQNLAEINAAFDATFFLRAWPALLREKIARYPEQMCRPSPLPTGVGN
ncbi:MAG: linear amide C-N hydrolase [Planctomycetota bacterium]